MGGLLTAALLPTNSRVIFIHQTAPAAALSAAAHATQQASNEQPICVTSFNGDVIKLS